MRIEEARAGNAAWEKSIEFDLVAEKINASLSGQFAGNSSSSESKGRAGNPAKSKMNREAVVMASLASFSELERVI